MSVAKRAAACAADPAARSFNPDVSLILQGLYKQAKPESGAAITGFLPATHGHDATAPERTRGFLLGESELTLSANVDQNFKATGRAPRSRRPGSRPWRCRTA